MSKLPAMLMLFLPLFADARETLTRYFEKPPEDVAMMIIEDISHFRRPSKKEQPVARYFKHLFNEMKPIWAELGHDITLDADRVGNIVIRLPATGHFAPNAPTLAAQAHMDMVEKARDKKTPLDVQFADGVNLVIDGDVVHTKDFANTAGLDNSVGLAFCALFLLRPELAHGPLEIVLTVGEEAGLIGAKRFGHTLKAKRMISMDWEYDDEMCNSCLGDHRVFASGGVPLDFVNQKQLRELTVTLNAFPGGHSGLAIHEPRPNAAIFAAELLARISGPAPEFFLLEASTEKDNAYNAIPDVFTFTLAAYPSDLGRLSGLLAQAFTDMKVERKYGAQSLALDINPGALPRANLGASKARTNELLSVVTEIHNGVIERGDEYPHGVRTSSNLGQFEFVNGQARVGFLLRSFDQEPLERLSKVNRDIIRARWPKGESPRFSPVEKSPTWWNSPDTSLYEIARQINPKMKTVRASGGLELAIFAAEHPSIEEATTFGVLIEEAHTPDERSYVSSIKRGARFTIDFVAAQPATCEVLLHAAE
jgi:dipeptidase D